MTAKLSQLLCFVTLTVLSACSFTRHSHTAREQAPPPSKVSTRSDLTFIDNISIHQNGKASVHNVEGFESKVPATPAHPIHASMLQRKFAKFLEVAPSQVIANPDLWSFIDNWWGTPYRYGGESRNGIDCSAFVQALYSIVFGISTLPRTAQQQYSDSRKIKRIKNLKPGDLVFFRIHSRHISHVGVYLQNNKFVNASSSSGVTISDLTDHYWKRYFVCGGEPKEANENMAFTPSRERPERSLSVKN